MTGCLLFAALLGAAVGVCAAGQSVATGSVTGKVVQDPGGQGIRKVVVELVEGETGEGGREYRTATDASGVFRLEGVEPGQYFVELSRAGYFAPKKGAKEWTVTVEAGKEASGAVYKMQATGVITGRVVDAEGDPLASAGVRAIRKGKSTAVTQPVVGDSVRSAGVTNDLGEYRIAELEPGQYQI